MRPDQKLTDIISADVVEITVDDTGKIWVNVDGECRLRIGKATVVNYDIQNLRAPVITLVETAKYG
jgi:hypothetical protein